MLPLIPAQHTETLLVLLSGDKIGQARGIKCTFWGSSSACLLEAELPRPAPIVLDDTSSRLHALAARGKNRMCSPRN
jgi:hypothetical protein